VVLRDEPFAVGEDLVVVLHDGVRRKPAVFLRQAHRPARRMEAHADLARGTDLGRDEIARAAGVHVEVIGRRCAAAEREFRDADPRGDVRALFVEIRPARVQRRQPLEQRAVDRGPEAPREVLVDVMVRVDEAGRDEAVLGAQDARRIRHRVGRSADRLHEPVRDGDPAALDLAPGVVDRRDEERVAYEEIATARVGPVRRHHGDDGRRTAAAPSSRADIVHSPVIRQQPRNRSVRRP
jgi:hypothetical protein